MKKIKYIKYIILLVICTITLILCTQIRFVFGSGASMYPTYDTFKILFCVKQKDYKVDDIIYYKIDNYKVVHRVIAIIDDGTLIQYKAKGDGNNETDRYLITKTNIKCKVV